MRYTIETLGIALKLPFVGPGDTPIEHLVIDSRNITFPEESLFFSLEGTRNDGHNFIKPLIASGVKAFVVRDDYTDFVENISYIISPDPIHTLQSFGRLRRQHWDGLCIGITGSNGKTTIKEWLAQVLESQVGVSKTPQSYNSQIGVPLSLWGLHDRDEVALIEAGISQPGEMKTLAGLIQPQWGIFSTLGMAHQSNFSSLRQKCKEKMSLFHGSERLILCRDHQEVWEEAQALEAQLFTWGQHEHSDLRLLRKQVFAGRTELCLLYQGEEVQLSIARVGAGAIENVMHVISAGLLLGLSWEVLRKGVSTLPSLPMRQELKAGVRDCLLINDSYSVDMLSLGIALENLNQMVRDTAKQKVVVLSDLVQTGHSEQAWCEEVCSWLQGQKVDLFIAVGEVFYAHAALFSGLNNKIFKDKASLLLSGELDGIRDAVVLVKGARAFAFEELVKYLEYKSYQTTLEIDVKALRENYQYFRNKLKSQTGVIAMLKANAYGCGSIEVARYLQSWACDCFGVALADEGVALRKAHIHKPIIVMNPEVHAFEDLIVHRLEPVIYSLELLQDFLNCGRKQGLVSYPVHLKVDTGMHRLGLSPADIKQVGTILQSQSIVHVKTVFSHLAASGDEAFDAFTQKQCKTLEQACEQLNEYIPYSFKKHILNSHGAQRHLNYQYDYVRLGIGLYGTGEDSDLQVVSRLSTRILQVKDVSQGDYIGYTCHIIAERAMRLAILPIGYADGFDRKLGNGVGKVMIEGRIFPTVGVVSMDMCMIDITGELFRAGTEVVIWNKQLTPSNMAKSLDTIPYEILTKVDERVKRIYYL